MSLSWTPKSSAEVTTRTSAVVAALEYLRRETGIAIPEYRVPVLEAVLARLARERDHPVQNFEALRREPEALREVLHAVTVPETFLFRHFGHYQALADLATQRFQAGRPCRVLSAGCATGEEAWSAAAVLAKIFLPRSRRFRVDGWDLDPSRIRQAKEGRFRDWSARSGLHGYSGSFRRIARGWEVAENLRPFVDFRTVNMVAEIPTEQVYDAVFFRNVAIYWTAKTSHQVVRRLIAGLADDGLLLVGPADPVELPQSWKPSIVDAARLYRRREPEPSRRRRPSTAIATATEAGVLPTLVRTSSRPAAAVAPEPERTWLEEARELADGGQTAAALGKIESHEESLTPEARLLAGVLLLELDRVEEAARRFREAIFFDAEEAVYHTWLAVALERLGRSTEAEREYRNAREISRR